MIRNFSAQAISLNLSIYITGKLIRSPQKAFSAFIMKVSILATSLSVAAMIIAMSFINGFQEVIAEKIFGFWGHVRVQHFEPLKPGMSEETPISSNSKVAEALRSNKEIASVVPFATKSAILNANGTIEGVLLKGVGIDYPFKKLNSFLTKGRWPAIPDSGLGLEVAISAHTAGQLSIDTGASMLIYFIQENGNPPRTRKVRVSGIFKTGMDVYDKTYAIGDLKLIQRLNQWEPQQIGGYEIDLYDNRAMEAVAMGIFPQLPSGWNALSLRELSPEIFDWLRLQDTNRYILITLMVIVAAINLITCLLILVLERMRMIALFKAMGARDSIIQRVFIYYGSWIAGIGIAIGTGSGLFLCYLQSRYHLITLNEEAYYVDYAPVSVDPVQVIAIMVGTLIITMLILVIPSWLSRKIQPAKALQFN